MTTLPDDKRHVIASAAIAAVHEMRHFSTGAMAELRRMDAANPAAAFWRIAVRNRIMMDDQPNWVTILRILALLTPKGEPPPEGRPLLHNPARPFGRVLCDGGDPTWQPQGDNPDGVVGERRLMQLLATRGPARAVALERAARRLAPRIQPGSGVDVAQIALALLDPDDTASIASAYFRRLDGATRTASEEKTE